jgi:NAD+--asparagine ADP-ribosyltransferase
MAKAIATTDPEELERAISELREALSEHIQRVRKMAATKLPMPRKRKTDDLP